MVALISIFLALGLLGLIVYGLHRHQTMEVEYQVERTMPLPPIGGERGKVEYPEQDAFQNSSAAQTRVRSNSPSNDKSAPLAAAGRTVDAPGKSRWQDQLSEAKQAGKFDLAFDICRQQFPLWSAFNQGCITLRSQLKTDKLAANQHDTLLRQLYRTAAIAELLHDKSAGAESFKLQQLRNIDLASIEALDFPYQEIGYAQLRLIRKTDVKLMLASWGRPKTHRYPREHHQSWWESTAAAVRG